ncbi:resuscitation-promoting factor protein RpfB [Brevibacterium samyangense]|uniref:Resuscitation-promoting factor protein RpfB n=2 Tax=Brevibacterium samyangense TaxID=366888 RepID=A0ABN2T8H7_9MICO
MDILRNRAVQIAAQSVVIGGLVVGTGAFVVLNKPVTVTVDGETQEVRTFGTSVDEVIAAQELDLSERDQVLPGRGASVDRGMDIVVNTTKTVDVTVDGVTTEETTTANTVGAALADLGIDAENAEVSTDLDAALASETVTDGVSAVEVVTPKSVSVSADGETHKVDEAASTVADVLDSAGITVDNDDIVSVPLDAPATDGQNVQVMRVTVEQRTEEEAIEHPVKTEESDDMEIGETEVTTEGKDGKREVVYEVRTVDGEEVSKKELSEKVLEEPVEEVVVEGTKDPMDMTTEEIKAMLGGPGSRWYELVKCESTFNPRAVNQQNNAHFGLFQFKQATWESVGGTGNPIDASPKEQFERAKILQQKAGWGQWACA